MHAQGWHKGGPCATVAPCPAALLSMPPAALQEAAQLGLGSVVGRPLLFQAHATTLAPSLADTGAPPAAPGLPCCRCLSPSLGRRSCSAVACPSLAGCPQAARAPAASPGSAAPTPRRLSPRSLSWVRGPAAASLPQAPPHMSCRPRQAGMQAPSTLTLTPPPPTPCHLQACSRWMPCASCSRQSPQRSLPRAPPLPAARAACWTLAAARRWRSRERQQGLGRGAAGPGAQPPASALPHVYTAITHASTRPLACPAPLLLAARSIKTSSGALAILSLDCAGGAARQRILVAGDQSRAEFVGGLAASELQTVGGGACGCRGGVGKAPGLLFWLPCPLACPCDCPRDCHSVAGPCCPATRPDSSAHLQKFSPPCPHLLAGGHQALPGRGDGGGAAPHGSARLPACRRRHGSRARVAALRSAGASVVRFCRSSRRHRRGGGGGGGWQGVQQAGQRGGEHG